MRFWFSQAPVYPQRIKDLLGLFFGGSGTAIAAVVAWLALPAELRLLVTFGTWLSLGLLMLLVGRRWARRRGLPFISPEEAKPLNLLKEGTRPLSELLLWDLLPSGVLGGLMMAQVIDGHPFWDADNLPWTTVAIFGIVTVISGVRRRARAARRIRTQAGAST